MGPKRSRPRNFTHSSRKKSNATRRNTVRRVSKPTQELNLDVLREIRQRLGLISSCVTVVQHALTEQSDMLDDDAALVLQRHVSDPLHINLMKLDRLLGRDVHEDDIEEGE